MSVVNTLALIIPYPSFKAYNLLFTIDNILLFETVGTSDNSSKIICGESLIFNTFKTYFKWNFPFFINS